MNQIIRDQSIVETDYQIVTEVSDPGIKGQILPMNALLEHIASLSGRRDLGVWLDADEDVEELEVHLDQIDVIALNFPMYNDGRALSSANILRRRYGFEGEIRAIGDVRRDQLEQMQRCGFNAYSMAEGQDVAASLNGLKGFSHSYQAAIDRTDPLFRSR
ncbi:MAG: DUF934 domain-containing protein [Pseudomonadota bacterium]|nr:DUF934 domain-containing protein [Pseudomonadota bacterium]